MNMTVTFALFKAKIAYINELTESFDLARELPIVWLREIRIAFLQRNPDKNDLIKIINKFKKLIIKLLSKDNQQSRDSEQRILLYKHCREIEILCEMLYFEFFDEEFPHEE